VPRCLGGRTAECAHLTRRRRILFLLCPGRVRRVQWANELLVAVLPISWLCLDLKSMPASMTGINSRTYRSNTTSPLHFMNPFHFHSQNNASGGTSSHTMAIFGKKKDKSQQEAANNAGSPLTTSQDAFAGGSLMNGNSRTPPNDQQYGSVPRSSLSNNGPGPPGMPRDFAPNGMPMNQSSLRGPPNGMQGPPPQQMQEGVHPGAAGGFRFGGPAPRPDQNGQSGIPGPGGPMRGPGLASRKMSMEPENQQGMIGPNAGGIGMGGVPMSNSGIPMSSQGAPGSPPDRPRTQQVVYPWSQRTLFMNPPRFLDEARQAPPGALSPTPFPRYGHAANAFASANGEVYLFGGLVRESVKNDLYVVYVDKVAQPPSAITGVAAGNVNATLVQTMGEIPPPRVGHATILVANVLILWGGDTKVRADDKQDEGLYLLNLSTREWTRVRQSSDSENEGPVGRYGHTVAIVGSRFFVFGGQVDGTFMNDLWTFDLNSLKTTPTWDVLTPATDVPPRRTGHASITHKDKIYIFGGTDGQYHYNDTWCYDVASNSWSELSCIGYIPVPREGHAACLVDDVMYIFGGRGVDGKDLGDLASFRISNQRWYMFANMGPSPSGRSGHALTTYQNKVVVLGGESFTGAKADDPALVHVLDTGKIKYPPEATKTSSPPANAVPRKSSAGNANDAMGRSMSPTERAMSPTQRGMGGTRNDSLVGIMQKAPMVPNDQQPMQQQQQQPINQMNNQTAPVNRSSPSTGPAPLPPMANEAAPGSRVVTPPSATTSRGTPVPAAPLQQASTFTPAAAPSSRTTTPAQAPGSVPMYTGPKSQRSHENMRNGATSPASQNQRGINGVPTAAAAVGAGTVGSAAGYYAERANAVASPPSDGFHYGPNSTQQNGAMQRGSPANQSTISNTEVDTLRKREAWMKAALAMAAKRGFVVPEQLDAGESPTSATSRRAPTDFTLDDVDTGADGSDKEKVLRAVIGLKTQLAQAKSMLAQQAQGEADRVAEAERGRSAALSEAAFYRAKMEALESGNVSEADRLQRGRNADLEKQLTITLRECGDLERQLERAREEVQLEQQLRASAEERLSETSKRVVTAEQAQMQVHEEYGQLQKKSYLYESELRDHKERVANLSTMATTHQLNHQEAQRQLQDTQTNADRHLSALRDVQAALAASTARASEHEQLHYQNRDLVQQHERTISSLRSDLTARSAEVDHHVSRTAELESLVAKHREEADTHKLAVNNGLSQVLAYHQQQLANKRRSVDGGDGVPPHVQERMQAMQEESETLRQLHSESRETADSANSLLHEMRERNFGLQKQQSGLKSELNAMRGQLAIALQEVARLKDHSSSKDYELRDTKRMMESTSVKHNLLKQMMTERGVTVPGDDELNAKNGYADKRLRQLEEQLDSQSQELQETEQRLRESNNRVDELTRKLKEQSGSGGTRNRRDSMTGTVFNDKLTAAQKRADDAEREVQETNNSYRERMSQLENDYQTAVQFVKGSEKMLRRMKDELTRYKTENTSLQSELVSVRSGNYGPSSDTEAIRDIEALRTRLADLTRENASVGVENRELERKLATLTSEHRSAVSDKRRSLLDGSSSVDSRRAKDLEAQVSQLEGSLNNVRKELQETLDLNTHLSNELKATTRRTSMNGTPLKAKHSSASLAKDLSNAQLQNEHLSAEKDSLAQRLQDAEDKLQLLLGRVEGNDANGNPMRNSHTFSISSELDKWERDRANEAYGTLGAK
jgi:chromosome segregation ATPase